MQLPAGLLNVGLSGATNAVAGTSTSHTILAAPGPSLRYRVWAFNLIWRWNGAGILEAIYQDGAANGLGYGAVSDQARADELYLPGGAVAGGNQSLVMLSRASGVSQPFLLRVFYTLEATA